MQSMTGYGSAQVQGEPGSVTIEIRSVNSRYLDLSFRIPEELRQAEMPLRDLITRNIRRGKVEVRASYVRAAGTNDELVSDQLLEAVYQTYRKASKVIPSLQAPTLSDILNWPDASRNPSDPGQWQTICQQACTQALSQLIENRAREGERLAVILDDLASQIDENVRALESRLPELVRLQHERLVNRMKEALEQAMPAGNLSAADFSERLNAEAGIFSLKADVAEELARLRSHLCELRSIIRTPECQTGSSPVKSAPAQSKGHGKRLDFLFQEMNREANTLGSKAVHMDMTRTAIDLKLLIEQMREQIQNIE